VIEKEQAERLENSIIYLWKNQKGIHMNAFFG
jgi:hypothetical protein